MPNFTTFSVLFFTRKLKKNSGELSIYARITINGKCSEMSLKRKISVNQWDASRGKLRGSTSRIRDLNSYLNQVYSKLLEIHKKLMSQDSLITARRVKAAYLGLDEDHKTLNDIVEYHNSLMSSNLKWGTLKNYFTTAKYLKEFLLFTKHTDNIFLRHINFQFIVEFEKFLRTYKPKKARRTCGTNGVMKHLERFQKLLNLAIKLEWLEKTPFSRYSLRFEKNERQFLSPYELQLLEETIFYNPSLEKVKDIFLFSCYSGLSYLDLKELTKNQLVKGLDGKDWIYTKRSKTNESVKIPLLNRARKLLYKYKDNGNNKIASVFPVLSNQKTNKYLKEIMIAAGINKTITFHSARHTFATTVTLSNGVPIETVSKLLGHTKLSTTQIYARVLENKLSSDIDDLEKILASKSS